MALVELPQPTPAADELVIEVRACGVCGTDLHIYQGEYAEPPIVPGHEFAGIVVSVGERVESFRPGDRVAVEPNIACNQCEMCLSGRSNFCERWEAVGVTRQGAMAEYVSVPERAAFEIEPLAFEQALFMEPLSCVIHGIERAQINLADRVLIIGAGPIGILLLQSCRVVGASRIDVVDKQERRLHHAERNGACEISSEFITRKEESYDVVIDATGAPEALEQSVRYLRPGGRLLWFGVPPAHAEVTLNPFTLFRKELTLLSSFTSVRNSLQALRMLQCNRISVAGLVSDHVALPDVGDLFAGYGSHSGDRMKAVVVPQQA
jgi:2-desacetyl-2-hydroxyethyl bacteriochlorophyllide A dehydrogenase